MSNQLGSRVLLASNFGTVKYVGPLQHQDKPQDQADSIWAGVEWDDETRGKHNGTVSDFQYFQTEQNKTSGSLVKIEKLDFGQDILQGLLLKYFKEVPNDLDKASAEEMVELVKQLSEMQMQSKQEGESFTNIRNQQISIEKDDEAFFQTIRKHKKTVEFLGFDKIWKRINDLKNLKELSLMSMRISKVGGINYISKVLPSLKELSLEQNLIYDWNQVFIIGHELQNLKQLSISQNIFREFKEDIATHEILLIEDQNQKAGIQALNVFKELKTLILVNMQMSWKIVMSVLGAFQNLKELILCHNVMTDFEHINEKSEHFQNLEFINLENCYIQDFEHIGKKLQNLPNLKKIILNKNPILQFGNFEGFQSLTSLSLERCQLTEGFSISQLALYQNLDYLNVKHNPLADKIGAANLRQRVVAECALLKTVNGSELKKYERKDCELYYLRTVFKEYFAIYNIQDNVYLIEDFNLWAQNNHPNVFRLIKLHGNPFEPNTQEFVDEMKKKQKEEENNWQLSQMQLNYANLKLTAAAGPFLGKESIYKKFPMTTLVSSLKISLGGLFKIPSKQIVLHVKINPHDPMEKMEDNHKNIREYSVCSGTEIIIDQQQQDQ